MASSKYYGDTAKKRVWLEVLTGQVCADKAVISLTKSPEVGPFHKITLQNEELSEFPIGMAMTEMLRIIKEMEAAFLCATGKPYSFEEARHLVWHGVSRRDEANTWAETFGKTAKQIWHGDVRNLYD